MSAPLGRDVPGMGIDGLIKEAAMLRGAGQTWAEIATAVRRVEVTVEAWPRRFPERWEHWAEVAAEHRARAVAETADRLVSAAIDGGVEGIAALRRIVVGDLPSAGDEDAGLKAVPAQVREAAAHALATHALRLVADHLRHEAQQAEREREMVSLDVLRDFADRLSEIATTYVPESKIEEFRRQALALPLRSG